MTKKIYIKLAVFLVAISIISMSNIFASNITNTNQENNTKINENQDVENNEKEENKYTDKEILTEEEIKQIEQLNNIIKELIKGIKNKIKSIDDNIKRLRDIEEYKTYPAIRLNVDTPIFGLDSVVNSKLKIKQEVSATDIAKGYSIKYIVKNNSIKLPDKYIAGIIVSTKDVKFDENISLNDANATVLKLMQYTKTVDNTLEFLENQTNKIFKGYIQKSKSENLLDIQRKLNKLNDNLLKQDESLTKLHIVLTNKEDREKYNKDIELYNDLSKKIKENSRKINNILISNEELMKVQKEVLELESKMIDFSLEIDKKLDSAKENIDKEKILISLKEELKQRYSKIDNIVENSVTKKIIEKQDDNNEDNTKELENSNEENQENNIQNTEEIKNYDISSKNILTMIDENIINVIDKKIEDYKKEENKEDKKDDTNVSSEDNDDIEQEENKEEVLKKKKEENENFITEVFNLYKDYILKENKFYFDNVNYILKSTTSKISDLSKYTKTDILDQMRYIYLELPSSLENYLDSNNLSSTLETRNLSDKLNEELVKLLNVYVKTSKIYDELNVNEIKTKA